MDASVICTAITAFATVVVALITNRLKTDSKHSAEDQSKALHDLQEDVAKMRSELTENNIQTARLDLCQAITHSPKEHQAILKLAWHYFVELGGDAWMSTMFKEWAGKEGVEISHISKHVTHLR